jgi:hypothetical protein
MDFESLIIKRVRDKKKKSTHEKLEHIKNKYKNSISRNLNTECIRDEVFNLVKFTIIFVEKYGIKIAEIIATTVTGEFKLSTCLSLVREFVTSNEYSDDFIINTVDSLVSLLFNTKVVMPPTPKKEECREENKDLISVETLPVIEEKKLKRSKSVSGKKVRFWN